MSPDLERLIEAYYHVLIAEAHEEPKALQTYRRLFDDAAAKLPAGASRDVLQDAIRTRTAQMIKARKKFSSLPPRA